jgi:hypothetical protein
VERDLLQVEEFSRKLNAKAARIDASEEAFAATRLLAQEGLDARRWPHDITSVSKVVVATWFSSGCFSSLCLRPRPERAGQHVWRPLI